MIFNRPILHALRLAVPRQQDRIASIACLFGWQCPSAILFRIAKVVVDAFDSITWRWGFAHIRVVLDEAPPCFRDGDTTTSITRIAYVVGVVATFHHAAPAPISARASHTVSKI